ncbi:bax inhibitor I [Loa loa]|uniref:Bax inhibitor I n=2 Tax=Loa loa TaxID=7209 RepID=A0A1S0TRQ1_LOALO|nr:bax inhibitor I [Loa loa]EFO18358.2 bax inhibitor I [Loa loa]
MAYRRESMRDDSDIFRNVRNIFTSLNDKLEKDVQEHLRAVYGTLALGLIAATFGALLHLFIDFLHDNFFLLFGSVLLMVAILKTPHTVYNERKRFGYFIAFCALSGVGSGPVIEKALVVDPSTILTAFLAAAVVFSCFTMAALYAPSTKFLHLGGIITSGLFFIMMTAVFSHSALMHTTCFWLAFVINCTLVLYDTQLICEKRRRGDTDYILHTIEIFIDFINLFRYILAILSEKKERTNRKRND